MTAKGQNEGRFLGDGTVLYFDCSGDGMILSIDVYIYVHTDVYAKKSESEVYK